MLPSTCNVWFNLIKNFLSNSKRQPHGGATESRQRKHIATHIAQAQTHTWSHLHTLLYQESQWVHPVTSVGFWNEPRASKPLLYLLHLRQAFSSLISPLSLLTETLSFPLNPSLPSALHFGSFHLSSFHLLFSSFTLSSLASVLSASRIFPWFRFSFPSYITLLSPLPHCSLQPLTCFLPSSFHHSIPFLPWLSPRCVFTACYLGDFKEA